VISINPSLSNVKALSLYCAILSLRKEGHMNYLNWSNEYYDTANKLLQVIKELKDSRITVKPSEKKDLDLKITQYKIYHAECLQIANHLMLRHKGVE
jgi:hypothetical protein